MKPVHFLINIITAAVLVTFCNYVVDIPLALAVKGLFRTSRIWARYAADIPDTLLYAVCVMTLVSFAEYLVRARKHIFDGATRFFLLVTVAVPLSFALKVVLKLVFGRVNTRVWLAKPELYGFHWFHGSGFGGGFPSGHMMVFTVLIAALWRYYPRYRPLYLASSLLLAAALVATNYHFLGDVVGGAYLGVLVEVVTYQALSRTSSKF